MDERFVKLTLQALGATALAAGLAKAKSRLELSMAKVARESAVAERWLLSFWGSQIASGMRSSYSIGRVDCCRGADLIGTWPNQ